MPIAPLFVPTHADLRKKLRLTPLETGTDAEAMLDDSISEVRVGFIGRLGLTRVAQLAGFPYTVTPSTNDEYLRLLAAQTEVKWVRLSLTESFRLAFMDASGDLLKRWNEEPMFREMGPDDLDALIKRLEAEIEEALGILSGTDEVPSSINVWDGAPDDPTPALGDTLQRVPAWANLLSPDLG